MRSARFGFREEPVYEEPICTSCGRADGSGKPPCMSCPPEPGEHRGSGMPDLIREAAADPLFAHAVFNEFAPDEEALLEKAGGRR